MLLGTCLLDICSCQKQGHMENDVHKALIKKKEANITGSFI